MTITYPLDHPTTGISGLEFGPSSVIGMTESPFTLEQQVQEHSGEAWAGRVTVSPMVNRDVYEPWMAFLTALRGRRGTFLFGDPAGAAPRGTATGTPVADSAGSPSVNLARDRVLYTRGWTSGVSGILKAGDWLQLGSGSSARLHKVLQDASSDSSGYAAIDIFPALRADVADAAAITVQSAKGVFRLADNRPRWTLMDGIVAAVSFDIIEAL
jgi:hypothetical protein